MNFTLFNNNTTIKDLKEGCVMLVDKPLKWTSFDVVRKLSSILGKEIKIGHGGTLDPLATGLLIIGTGKATKALMQFQNDVKSYEVEICIGATTPSYDLETPIDKEFDIQHINEAKLTEAIMSFVGEYSQYPPIHSAVKINGKPAYIKARKQEEVALSPRLINIFEIELQSILLPKANFTVTCSKGTYIRSLANDIGTKLSNGAHLTALRRLQSGDFYISNAMSIEDVCLQCKQIIAKR